ncbi:L-pipecolate oxidase [Leucoagaricus sp. SymC.cos]|nr:L-pipecolate oxidase [Leucoagaricus sp. SymC.cos]
MTRTDNAAVEVPRQETHVSPDATPTSSQSTSGEGGIIQDPQVVIVGAGCFGLSTAYHLMMRGYTDITLLDRSTILPAPDASSNDINRSCFGLSTAYHLMMRGYTDITLLDRSTILPAPDASSNDINRIVRSSYNDKFYAGLAREAIDAWKDRKFWGDTYHGDEGNDVVPATGTPSYTDESLLNELELGCSLLLLPDSESIRSAFPSDVPVGSFKGDGVQSMHRMGYLNHDGGWADAGQGVRILLSEVKRLGAKVLPGKSVSCVQQTNGRVTGVLCADNTLYDADLVVIATGSWTPSTFPELKLHETCLATGQCVAMIQLTEEEAAVYQDCPVVLDFTSGFYAFPPTAKNVLKVAIHGPGFTHRAKSNISTPRTILSDPDTGLAIPKHVLQELRKGLREVYPDLAKKDFSCTRLCWYNDSPDGDWVISRHDEVHNLVFATGGSGHAYKFLPVIGRLVADLIEDNLEPALVEKFAMSRAHVRLDGSRSGAPMELDLSRLCLPADLASLER